MCITAGRAEEHDARECSVAACGSDFGKLRHLCFADMSVCSTAHISFCQSLQFSVEVLLRSGKACKSVLARSPR